MTPEGIVIDVREVQFLNTLVPNVFKFDGKVILSSEVQSVNRLVPNEVILSCKVTVLSLEQPLKI